ncbi:hypothetical protein [Acinetobacter johnsonii]|uniref:hypothetical protein n=1 Tax=Acinetobacter johnsonii TaxID=40214 RepID=UPI00398D5240
MISFDFDIQQRMELQRKLLKSVNSKCHFTYQLHGLSYSAIDLWEKTNKKIEPTLVHTLKHVASSLLVLSTRSQESIDVQDLNFGELQNALSTLENILNNM